jgi:hypothetical protein
MNDGTHSRLSPELASRRPLSPLARKQQRFTSGHGNTSVSAPTAYDIDTDFSDCLSLPDLAHSTSRSPTPAISAPAHPDPTPPSTFISPRTKRSHTALEEQSQQIRLQMVAREQNDKQTKRTYLRHYHHYLAWWESSQAEVAREDPTRRALPALPITPAKVALFMNHEVTREKVSLAVPVPSMISHHRHLVA